MTHECIEQKLDADQAVSETEKTLQADDKAIEALARKFRRAGYAFFGGVALALCALLIYVAVTAFQAGEVYDPFTGEKVGAAPDASK